MSAFVVTYNKQFNTPGNPGVLNLVMDLLSHRGPDGMALYASEKISMGHWHFWTTPEDTGEQQPLYFRKAGLRLVFDGRIDNRVELCKLLGLESGDHSDAVLFLNSYTRWEANGFKKLVGEFAAVLYDEKNDRVLCVRDQLGDRTLFYAEHRGQLIIASEPWPIARALNRESAINHRAVAYFFDNKTPPQNETYFDGIYEILPAQILTVQGSSIHSEIYWQPDLSRLHLKDDRDYAGQFLNLLEESVLCRLRSNVPVGIMMSGGLDSTSVAALAARSVTPSRLKTISFTFPSIPESDEKTYIDAMQQKWNLDSVQIPCDDVWTFKDWGSWKPNPNHPGGGVHYHMMQRVYQNAQREGLHVLLTGAGGDPLYHAGGEWLTSLLMEGRIWESFRQLFILARNYGLKPLLPLARHVLADFLHLFITPARRIARNELLTDYSQSFLGENASPRHVPMALDPSFSFSISRDAFTASRFGIEIRNPYRDRRLVEFALRLPAHQFFKNGVYKHVLRNAMSGILPEVIRSRKFATSILPLYLRAFKEEKWLASEINRAAGHLSKFINPAVVLKSIENPGSSSKHILSAWQCLSYDKWHHSFI